MVGGGVAGMHTYPKPYSRRVAHAGALLWAAMAGVVASLACTHNPGP